MAKFLCTAKSNTNSDSAIDRRGCHKKGYPTLAKEDDYIPSRSECPPNHVFICVPEITVEQANAFCNDWRQEIDYNVLEANADVGTYQVEVFGSNLSVNTNPDLNASITKEQIENFLTRWGCTVDSFTINSVTFTIALWQALQSEGYWDRPVASFAFVLDGYDPILGIATVTVNNISNIEPAISLIEQKGGIVTGQTIVSVSFTMERSILLSKFQSDVKSKTEGTWCRKQYYFSEAVIDQALAMQDTFDGETQLTWKGQVELTQIEAMAASNNKLDE